MMNEKLQNWAKATGELCKWFILVILALEYNGILGYMILQGTLNELNVGFWAIYSAVMAALGIPIVYKGFQAVKGKTSL